MGLSEEMRVTKSQRVISQKGLPCSSNPCFLQTKVNKQCLEAQGELSSSWATEQGLITGEECWGEAEFQFMKHKQECSKTDPVSEMAGNRNQCSLYAGQHRGANICGMWQSKISFR